MEKMAGMFKIVQTVERGLKQLTIVPSTWVNNNQLSWPKMGADKLVRKPNSIPEANWFTMVCKLKRNHLISYEIAEEELERMLENEDTEQEEITECSKKKHRPRVMLPKTTPCQNDFNSLAEKCLEAPLGESIESTEVITTTDVIVPQSVVNTTENLCYQIIPSDDNFSSVFQTQTITDPQLNEKLEKILANQEIVIQNQELILQNFQSSVENQNQIIMMQQLAKLETILDSVASNMAVNVSCSCKTTNQNLLGIKEDIFFDAIDTLEELEKLELKLANKTDMENYVQKFSYVCGRKGSGNGITNCYILVDKIFTRKFMTLCSWAGGARDGKEKIPFKICKNIISLFFRVVRLSDDDFTLKNCEDFFKAVIRNSTKRNESSLSRCSKSKKRPGSLSYKTRKGGKRTPETYSNSVEGSDTEESRGSHNPRKGGKRTPETDSNCVEETVEGSDTEESRGSHNNDAKLDEAAADVSEEEEIQ